MIRFILGLVIVLAIGGGIDNMPPDPSFSYLFWQGFFLALGFGLAASGVSRMRD
jgi:cell division protein FtsW (lipid II flippase)